MMKLVFIINYFIFIFLFCGIYGKKWTEEDEKRRIVQVCLDFMDFQGHFYLVDNCCQFFFMEM